MQRHKYHVLPNMHKEHEGGRVGVESEPRIGEYCHFVSSCSCDLLHFLISTPIVCRSFVFSNLFTSWGCRVLILKSLNIILSSSSVEVMSPSSSSSEVRFLTVCTCLKFYGSMNVLYHFCEFMQYKKKRRMYLKNFLLCNL